MSQTNPTEENSLDQIRKEMERRRARRNTPVEERVRQLHETVTKDQVKGEMFSLPHRLPEMTDEAYLRIFGKK